MEEKEVVTSGKITQGLIVGWFLWGILWGIIYTFLYRFITNFTDSLIIKSIIIIILQGIITFIIWKFSTKSTFKKRTMNSDDVPKVMKNLIVFTILICIINGVYQFFNANDAIDRAVNSNFQLRIRETMMSSLYDDEEMEEYNEEKEEFISDVKNQVYTYLVIVEIGLTAVYLLVLPLEKKEILKYVG